MAGMNVLRAPLALLLIFEGRPAIARITARMAFLIVLLERDGQTRDAVSARAREDFADTRLATEEVDRLVDAILALGAK